MDPMFPLERQRLIDEAKRCLPPHIPVDPPHTAEQAEFQRAEYAQRLRRIIEPLPPAVPLEPREIEQRAYRSYTEIKVTYMVEPEDPVPAYLLIPSSGTAPFPAIVAHHQCGIDCDLGKEAVVGKVVDRPDQAYALELVRRGFVVLAPDTKSCGERPAAGFRKMGECRPSEKFFKERHCYWGAHILPLLKTHTFPMKQAYDSLRAVDYLLTRTDLIDPDRIGMIGHSQGGGTTELSMALDPRVKAGVTSCGGIGGGLSRKWLTPDKPTPPGELRLWFHEHTAMIPPRAMLWTNGTREDWLSGLEAEKYFELANWSVSYGRYVSSLLGHDPENLQRIQFDGGHSFPPEVRTRAYEFLERHLGVPNEAATTMSVAG